MEEKLFLQTNCLFSLLATSPYNKHLRAGTRSAHGTSSCRRRAQLISLGLPIAVGLCGLTSSPWLGLNYATGCCIFSMEGDSLRQLLLSVISLQLNLYRTLLNYLTEKESPGQSLDNYPNKFRETYAH